MRRGPQLMALMFAFKSSVDLLDGRYTMKIIFPTELSNLSAAPVAVIHPTGELPIKAVAFKDVPIGVPYRFVEDGDIPSDRTYREAWEADFSNPDGYGGQA